MPYYITNQHPDCPKWAVVKSDYEVVACHGSKKAATDQMVAISLAEEIEPGGTHPRDKRKESVKKEAVADSIKEGDFVSWGSYRGRVEHVMTYGVLGLPGSEFALNASEQSPAATMRIYQEGPEGWEETEMLMNAMVSDLTKIGNLNEAFRLVEADGYKIPSGVQSAAKRALKWISEGKAGSGFTSTGRRRAQQLASGGSVGRDTVARMKSYFARHAVDKKATGFNAGEKGYPSPGRVAWDAWGGDAGRTWVNRVKLD